MSIKALIKKQTIIIDDHHWGAGEVKSWDDKSKDIHIDKKTQYKIDGKIQEVRIRLPINSDRKLSIEVKTKGVKKVPRKLEKEIKDAFKDKSIRKLFVQDLILTLENYSSNFDSLDNTKNALKRISKHFELNWTDNTIIKEIVNTIEIVKVEALPTDNNGKKYYISIDRKRIKIGYIGEELRRELIERGFEL